MVKIKIEHKEYLDFIRRDINFISLFVIISFTSTMREISGGLLFTDKAKIHNFPKTCPLTETSIGSLNCLTAFLGNNH